MKLWPNRFKTREGARTNLAFSLSVVFHGLLFFSVFYLAPRDIRVPRPVEFEINRAPPSQPKEEKKEEVEQKTVVDLTQVRNLEKLEKMKIHRSSKVTVVHRRESFRSEKILQERLFAHPKVEVVWNSLVDEILGQEGPLSVTGVRLKNVKTGATEERRVDGVFVAIGHAPASELFAGQVETKPNGYIKTVPGTTQTNIPGVFAAGDVADHRYRQAVTAAGSGCMAAIDAEKFLSH